ncbi:DUF6879 family protein [Streptomyces aidingensis]|uniref:DUF6879 domain-containing protein n=1 Tax=Streptomyces aidingensis TaxID=910347 RepID=A0A1I1HBF4_9ACTN|nr:DUF6879 family protein [Streptomyces aidingensis]SFC21294.1 hypothetical protein SAMN05421773_102325 [Streptomyces aidingensis]
MPSEVLEPLRLRRSAGERLTREVYRPDFRRRMEALRDSGFWKLERRQHFEEIGSASRDALRRGDWAAALRLFDERRPQLAQEKQKDAQRGLVKYRVRIVRQPLSPYVQWELHSLRQQAEYGTRVRVVRTEQLGGLEAAGPLPELVSLGGQVLYEVCYTRDGVPDGAIRFTAPDTVRRAEELIKGLYRIGEDIAPYFAREVAPLPPPPAA